MASWLKGGGKSRHEELRPGAGGSEWWNEQDGKSVLSSAAILGQANARTQDVQYTQREAKAIATDQGAPTRCSAWPARSGGQTKFLKQRNRMEKDQAKERLVSPVSPSIMGNPATLPKQGAWTTSRT